MRLHGSPAPAARSRRRETLTLARQHVDAAARWRIIGSRRV